MHQVLFKKASYDYNILKPDIYDMMDAIGGDQIQNGAKVLIKPNFLTPAKPEKAILTHPLILKAVAEYVLDKGARVRISDSPASGSFERLLRIGGYKEALQGMDIQFRPFQASVKVDIGKPFGMIDMAADALNTDLVINLPKLKTHSMMLLTLGVKNLFGCIVGLKKPEWHLRSGVDREMFAKLLLGIHNAVSPSLTLVDGILALEGDGPGRGGIPRHLGVLIGGCHAPTVDMAICQMLGVAPDTLLTHKVAKEMGMISELPEIIGDFCKVAGFQLPEAKAIVTPGPKSFQKFVRRHVTQRPVVNEQLCSVCGECWDYCPAQAITQEGKQITFDYDRCIRCYCCAEVCPHGALRVETPLAGKVLRLFSGLRKGD